MASLKITPIEKGKSLQLLFEGRIDEDATFPKLGPNFSEITIDWSGVKAINSCGIREWLRWIGGVPHTTSVKYTNCSRIIVNQINMIDGFLPRGGKVESFFVPYYCEPCESITSLLFSHKKEPTQQPQTPPATAECETCKRPAELDVVGSSYFRFLKGAY